MSVIEEKFIKDSLAPVSIQAMEIILDQMKNSVCKIHIEGNNGTGFFIEVLYNNKLYKLLITNYHVLKEKDIMIGNIINISLNNEKIFKEIKIDSNRKTYTNKNLDVTIIEIKKEDNINNFLLLDDNIINNNIHNYNNIYKNESLYILNYINGKDIYTSYGILNNVDENKIIHKCNTDQGSSGSPIILLKNNKVIGVHYGRPKQINFNFNYGSLLKIPILEYINKKDNNYIISEIIIKKEDIGKKLRIINSFEECIRNKYIRMDEKEYYKYESEKEIKENCKIKINDNNINFNYFHEFKEKGKYIIKYIFTNNLTKTNFMFSKCASLTSINLSNFNTQNVTDMSHMFSNCILLTNINLSNFNTQNVTNMRSMFSNCKSLTSINLSNFNTQNVTNMSFMFSDCKSLTNINLSNFNTQNVTNMESMFSDCKSLISINLCNFNTQNVTNMSFMFSNCISLTNINLSNFNTQKVTDMKWMFLDCTSLTNINLSNFNTQNATDLYGMFSNCKSLKKENIITKDNNILNEY